MIEMRPRILIACDKFKGSLSAVEVADAISAGLPEEWEVVRCPIADGGEGFVDAMLAAKGGVRVEVAAADALGRGCGACYGMSGKDAFIEMSAASGLWRIGAGERSPRTSSTWGTGRLMRHAIEASGAERLFIGIGGSATNDGGAGMAVALGVRFLDGDGAGLSGTPEDLERVASIDESALIPLPEIIAACDVENPLCGPRGASAVFGPQKGASPDDVAFLDAVLERLARVAGADGIALEPGTGAAGGLGFGLRRFAGARLVSGFSMVAEALGLERRIAEADLVITGEGSLDGQTLDGKGPAGVAGMARMAGVPVIAVAGRVEHAAAGLFDGVLSLQSFGFSKEESIARAASLVERLVAENAGGLKDLLFRQR